MTERKRAYRIALWGGSLLGVLIFIFANSLTPASASGEESGAVFSFLHEIFSFLTHHAVRKLAHFCEYALLGAHLAFAPLLLPLRSRGTALIPLLFGILIAFLDEGFQLFASGRAAMLTDVFIDCVGYFFGLLLFILIFVVIKRKQTERKEG